MEVNLSTLRFNLLKIWLLCLSVVILTIQIIAWGLPEDPYDAKKKDFELQADNIEALVMGVSHARAVHFQSMGIPGFSYHDPGSDLQTVFEKYRAISPLTPNLKYVLLPLSPSYLYVVRSDMQRTARESVYFRNYPKYTNFQGSLYWTLLLQEPQYLLQKLRKSLKKQFKKLISNSHTASKSPSCTPENSRDKPQQNGFIGGYFDIYAEGECLKSLAMVSIKMHLDLTLEKNGPEGNFEKNKFIMNKLITQIAANGHQLVLFIPPFTAEYYEHSTRDKIKTEQVGYLKELSLQPNVQFLDYHDLFYQRNYIERNTLFYDDNHLGLSGAMEFSKLFGEAIRDFDKY